jgi:hypothetical protein
MKQKCAPTHFDIRQAEPGDEVNEAWIEWANLERIRTAQLANREKRGLLRLRGPEPAVSGSDAREPDRQNPAESREFPGLDLGVCGKSLQPQTEWRWAQSSANPSLCPKI